MRLPLLLATFSLIMPAAATANVSYPLEAESHFNVGIRIGWNTESGDLLWGLEASYTYQGELTHGPVLNLDVREGGLRFGLGYEVVLVPPTLGVEIGPTLAITDGRLEAGWHATGFIGFLLFVHDQATWLPSGFTNEVGFTLKAPIPVNEIDYSGSPD